jgi:hypothetical protein
MMIRFDGGNTCGSLFLVRFAVRALGLWDFCGTAWGGTGGRDQHDTLVGGRAWRRGHHTIASCSWT